MKLNIQLVDYKGHKGIIAHDLANMIGWKTVNLLRAIKDYNDRFNLGPDFAPNIPKAITEIKAGEKIIKDQKFLFISWPKVFTVEENTYLIESRDLDWIENFLTGVILDGNPLEANV